MDVDGQLVSYDNRRLAASRLSEKETIPLDVVDPQAIMLGSKRHGSRHLISGGTWRSIVSMAIRSHQKDCQDFQR
jgi:hypothetical protein